MKHILNYLFTYKTLTKEQAKQVLIDISTQKYNHVEIASFLSVYAIRSVTIDEMSGFIEALQEGCIAIDLEGYNTIDMCGTGGDEKNTFNISTIASFVVAGAGVNVAKHGNYGVSSACGSSNLLESLGYVFSHDNEKLKTEIEKTGMCYMHAPLFHPPMKEVAPIRKQLGIRTFFNIAGPLVNPANPSAQAVGVYNLETARIYKYVLQNTHKKFIILHGLDGYDEISLTGNVKIMANDFERIATPEELGFSKVLPEHIFGGETVKEAVEICNAILHNKATEAQKNVVIINAAMGIKSIKSELSTDDCVAMARESLESKKALHVMKKLCNV
ncbi:MAG: anthranilate phosphoribosyltransferase [Bacteroidales bacterium]|nr:anthranilate phosphoribosyltransferase [Bacteroidales bacterium]